MLRQRIAADYLQTSAVIEPDGLVRSAVNDPNLYLGPGTGYRLEGERWALLQSLPHVVDPRSLGAAVADAAAIVEESGPAVAGNDPAEVVIAVGPAFADGLRETIAGLPHDDVLAAVVDGVREAGGSPRVVRILRAADVAFIGHDGAVLSGSGIALGLQSKGTAVIHRADLQPLDNLELFGMSPLYTLDSYRAMGRNAAGYALGHRVGPVPTELDNFARAKLIVRTTLLHAQEARAVVPGRGAGRARPRGARSRSEARDLPPHPVRRHSADRGAEQRADPVGHRERRRSERELPETGHEHAPPREQRDRGADPEQPERRERERRRDRRVPREEDERQDREDRADHEEHERHPRRDPWRAAQLVRVDAELLARVGVERGVRVGQRAVRRPSAPRAGWRPFCS